MESVRTVGVSKLSGLDKLSKIQRQPNPNFINTNYNSTKTLSLKQLKEVIDQIYESKLKFDEKNYQGKLARETMNQYLFTYLNQKYGLKVIYISYRVSLFKLPTISFQASRSTLPRTTMWLFLEKYCATKQTNSSDLCSPNSKQLSTIC